MNVAKIVLSVIATLTVVVAWPFLIFPAMRSGKATGFGVVVAGLWEAVFSPAAWLSAVVVFLLFFYAGRLNSKALRIVLFWIPTISPAVLGSAIFTLIMYAYSHRFKG